MMVTVTRALRAQMPVLQNLIQLYTHDFSEFWAGTSKGDLLPDGRFAPYPLDEYWTRPRWSASFIGSEGILAGFVLINDQAHSGEPVNRNVGEFFVLRKHRGQGVGCLAARAVFAQHPGSWEVAVARKNARARDFWRNAICGTTHAADVLELDLENEKWNGPVFRFNWNPALG